MVVEAVVVVFVFFSTELDIINIWLRLYCSKKWIKKTKSPIGSIKTSIKERIEIPKGIEKGIIETPVEIEKSPRIVIYVM